MAAILLDGRLCASIEICSLKILRSILVHTDMPNQALCCEQALTLRHVLQRRNDQLVAERDEARLCADSLCTLVAACAEQQQQSTVDLADLVRHLPKHPWHASRDLDQRPLQSDSARAERDSDAPASWHQLPVRQQTCHNIIVPC